MTPGLRISLAPVPTRWLVLALAVLGGLLALPATPARAVVTEVAGAKVGLQPPEMAHYWEGPTKWDGYGHGEAHPVAASFANAAGNPVLHTVKTYAIYWDPQDYYHGDWQGLIDGFLANAATAGGQLNSVFAVDAQYTDLTNQPAATQSSFMGGYTDTEPYPSSGCTNPQPLQLGAPLVGGIPPCLTDTQVRAQLEGFIAVHGLQKGVGTIFYLLTPPGVSVCLDAGGVTGHCSNFHGSPLEISEYEEASHGYPEQRTKYEEEKKAYEKEKKEKEAKSEPFTKEPPVAPTVPTPPTSYGGYLNSFCSYHSDISPTNPEDGDGNTILYAVIPWTAGEEGDAHFAPQIPGYDCQDGGFQPNTKPTAAELGEKEHEKPRTPKEEEEFAAKSSAQKRETEEAKELGLNKAHEQEPNQIGLGPDGSYDTGLADLIIDQIAVEQQNTVTDPLLDAWQDKARNEVTDECRNFFFPTTGSANVAGPRTRAGTLSNQQLGGKSYYLNDAFNLAALNLPYPGIACLPGVSLVPQFTAPVAANSGELVGFNGMESDITLNVGTDYSAKDASHVTYARYMWNFGDASPEVAGYAPGSPPGNPPAHLCEAPWLAPCASSTFHAYQYGGTYQVTLTVKDVAGDIASVTHPITVAGPPPPGPPPAPPATPTTSGSSGGSGSSGSGHGSPSLPAPLAKAAATSTSLKQVTRSGLVVDYSVNEQVAGRFEVLLESAVAHRLGISGPAAGGLPAGFPKSLVIGRALLVTVNGGKSSVRIKFSKSVARRLRRAHKVTLTLRLVVHNAASQHPLFTTVMSSAVLHR